MNESKSLLQILNDLAPSLEGVQMQQKGTTMNIIQEREKTHGDYKVQSVWSQTLKDMLRSTPNWGYMNDGQKEALELIATKLARLTHGDCNFLDHPKDIGGYADLYAMSIDLTPQQSVDEIARALGVQAP
jgi:hypothetical protein